jgi:hypothetical protein
MPRGPQGEKRPADVVGAAIMVAKIATGELEETGPTHSKNPAAVTRGRRGGAQGGRARADSLSPDERHRIAARAARKRWGGHSDGDTGNGGKGSE